MTDLRAHSVGCCAEATVQTSAKPVSLLSCDQDHNLSLKSVLLHASFVCESWCHGLFSFSLQGDRFYNYCSLSLVPGFNKKDRLIAPCFFLAMDVAEALTILLPFYFCWELHMHSTCQAFMRKCWWVKMFECEELPWKQKFSWWCWRIWEKWGSFSQVWE